MIDNLTYIVNTHVTYTTPLKVLLDSMQYVYPSNIIVIVAGDDGENVIDYSDYENIARKVNRIHFVSHNSYDYTGAIWLVENEPNDIHEHVAFIQDTMQFTRHTDILFKEGIDYPEIEATAVYGGQCNLAVYRYDYLLYRRHYISNQRNQTKLQSIEHEGALWKTAEHRGHFKDAELVIEGMSNPYSHILRIKERYTAIQLIKWKANYGQNMHALVTQP